MTDRTFTAYITKYCLTKGILSKTVENCGDRMVKTVDDRWTSYYHSQEWSRTHADAIRQSETMRLKKIASLNKQIAKLEKLRFVP